MKKILFFIIFSFLLSTPLFAMETAPRISDREIIDGLANIRGDIKGIRGEINRLGEGLKNMDERIDDTNKRIDGLRADMNARFSDLRTDMNSQFEALRWMIGIFIAIAMMTLGFILRLLWLMQKRQTAMETSLETQKDEIAFFKNLIEKLLPPRSVL